ncbi:hypothetical protein [Rhizobium sp. BK008]|uniref:hypothetical protein n=1 Tax=Rhizobium sp. BK008 TaxID=2587094 RepID=UPI00182E26AB|nr:hypothetical protein [Rhizobium sp. BK008]MBB4255718.1 hypothetical protein [Rhizobium sp. BK008]
MIDQRQIAADDSLRLFPWLVVGGAEQGGCQPAVRNKRQLTYCWVPLAGPQVDPPFHKYAALAQPDPERTVPSARKADRKNHAEDNYFNSSIDMFT